MRCDLQATGTEVDYSKSLQPGGIIQINPKYVLVFVNRKFSTNRTLQSTDFPPFSRSGVLCSASASAVCVYSTAWTQLHSLAGY